VESNSSFKKEEKQTNEQTKTRVFEEWSSLNSGRSAEEKVGD